MSMPLHTTIELKQIFEEPDRFDFLSNSAKALIKRIDEVHSTEDNDSSYVFLIWLQDGEDTPMFVHLMEEQIAKISTSRYEDWTTVVYAVCPGFVVVESHL